MERWWNVPVIVDRVFNKSMKLVPQTSKAEIVRRVSMLRLTSSFSCYHFIAWVAILAFYFSGCSLSKDQTGNTRSDETKPSLQPMEAKQSTQPVNKQSLETNLPIQSLGKQLGGKDITTIDFRNFTYPVTEDLRVRLPPPAFNVVEGSHSFQGGAKDSQVEINHLSTIYDHVTGKDSSLSAIIVFSVYYGTSGIMGSGRSHCVYIYNLQRGTLKLFWSFDTGDRADGGLRNIYGENSNLVVETYSSDIGFAGACCAKTFMRSTYEWIGFRFNLVEAKRFNNPLANASPMLGERK